MFVIDSFSDTLDLLWKALLIGALAGFITSLTRAPRSPQRSAYGMDNCLRFPVWIVGTGSKKRRGWNLGSLGPMLVGAAGAVFVVFSAGVGDQELDGTIVTGIEYAKLITLGVAGGAAGELIFRSLAQGSAVSLGAVDAAVKESAKAAADASSAQAAPAAVEQAALTAGRAAFVREGATPDPVAPEEPTG